MYSEIQNKDITLRPYQQHAKEEIFAAWDECNNVLFQMPTGTGKTRLFTSIISDIKTWSILNSTDSKILIIAHRIELIEQISESLNKYKISHGIIAGGKERNLRPSVQVASIQTITHHCNLDVAEALNIDFIIIDEAHHSIANSYRKLWSLYPDSKKLGVTATPWRMNHAGFKSIFDKLIVSDSIQSFIESGWLAPYKYYSIQNESALKRDIDTIDEFDTSGDYKISALERVMDRVSIRANLLDSYLNLARGKKGIIYSISRKHSEHICEEYRRAGINIVKIDGDTQRDERRLYVQRFKKGLIDIIVNVDIFSEGFDCPDIEFIQLARPTKSLIKYLQQVGRGLRPTKGKSKCLILDNVGAHFSFGLPDSDRMWNEEFEGYAISKTKSAKSNPSGERIPYEKSLSEGNDEMGLIQDVVGKETPNLNVPVDDWTESDSELLRVLYFDKQCPIEVIATVFKRDIEIIQSHIDELKLN